MNAYRAALAALSIPLAAALIIASKPAPSVAASGGLAWDSITKMTQNADTSTLSPGSFDADFAAASAAKTVNMGPAWMMGKSQKSAAQNAMLMMKECLAEHHYVAGSKERTDEIVAATATITDCAARTITTLDLGAKTYHVTSMDSPETGSSSGGGGSGSGRDSDTKIAITIVNTALGAKEVGGQPTNGYRSDMTITETSSSGSSTHNADVLGYYSNYASPSAACSRYAGREGASGRGMDMTGGYMRIMQALSSAGDPRFSFKQTGPALPLGKLSMFTAMSFSAGGRSGALITERGNVRTISDTDPIFSVPSDFTQR